MQVFLVFVPKKKKGKRDIHEVLLAVCRQVNITMHRHLSTLGDQKTKEPMLDTVATTQPCLLSRRTGMPFDPILAFSHPLQTLVPSPNGSHTTEPTILETIDRHPHHTVDG